MFIHERKNLVQLSDYIVNFLVRKGFEKAFLVSEGKIMHLLDSVRKNENMNYICNHHEQAAAIAAEAYSKASGKPGFLLIGGGSAGTNALTGIANAWIDSVPLIVISGQAHENQTIKNSGLRQLGVKELNIIDIVRPITKYAVVVKDKNKIKYHLEKAYHLATSGRPGPVWLDIPINLHTEKIHEDDLDDFKFEIEEINNLHLEEDVKKVIDSIKKSERPVILIGNGIRLSNSENEFLKLIEILDIPVLASKNAKDILWNDHPLYVGNPGAFGQRAANFAIQNSDLLLSIGSRVSLSITGWAYNDFARSAKKIIVDVDENELKKMNIRPDLSIKSDAKKFIFEMLNNLKDYEKKDIVLWKNKINDWKIKYPVVLEEYKKNNDHVNLYYFIDVLSDLLDENYFIVTDTGMSYHCTMQALKIKRGQRIISSGGLDSGGYGLPASIGASVSNNKKVVCICGDGGIQMNIQELSVIKKHNFPIKIFVINNKGISSMRMAQAYYFKNFTASDEKSGFPISDFKKIAEAYGLKTRRIENNNNLIREIKEVLDLDGPVLCELNVSENEEIRPKQGAFNRPDGKTVPRPIEDMIPFIGREELEKEMIIDPVPFDPYK